MAPKRSVGLGPIGQIVRANVARRRAERGLSAQQLSDAVSSEGYALGRGAISDIERGSRRVDVDDLVSLAAGLDCQPIDLLDPPAGENVIVSGFGAVTGETFFDWVRGAGPLMASADERAEWLELARHADQRLTSARMQSSAAWESVRSLTDEQSELVAAAADGSIDDEGRGELAQIRGELDRLTAAALEADRQLRLVEEMRDGVVGAFERRHGND